MFSDVCACAVCICAFKVYLRIKQIVHWLRLIILYGEKVFSIRWWKTKAELSFEISYFTILPNEASVTSDMGRHGCCNKRLMSTQTFLDTYVKFMSMPRIRQSFVGIQNTLNPFRCMHPAMERSESIAFVVTSRRNAKLKAIHIQIRRNEQKIDLRDLRSSITPANVR